jgi:hypothetical protein
MESSCSDGNFLANKFQFSYKISFEVILISKVKLYVGDFPTVQFCHFFVSV